MNPSRLCSPTAAPKRFCRFGRRPYWGGGGFTLIELIMVMAILTSMAALTAPTLSRFFRGRALDLEARRILSLTRAGQNRAISEGVPMDLWVDLARRTYGLEVEPTFEPSDAKAVSFLLDNDVKMEVVSGVQPPPTASSARKLTAGTPSVAKVSMVHPELPTIRFLPDGSLGENSPQALRLTGRSGEMLSVARTADGLGFEVTTVQNND